MSLGDEAWKKRNPQKFKLVFNKEDKYCECGKKIIDKGEFYRFQDHPWHKPKIICDCGKTHIVAGIRIDN